MFPATTPIIDPLDGPVGPLGANWVNGNFWGGTGLVIAAGGGALASSGGTACGQAWFQPVAIARSGFVTMAVLPTSTYAGCGALSDLPIGVGQISVALVVATQMLNLVTSGGNNLIALSGIANGDAIGWSYDPVTDLATAWYRPVGASAFVAKGTQAVGISKLAPTGWWLYMETDSTAVRMRNFGGELLPGALAGAVVTSPFVHGRGAC